MRTFKQYVIITFGMFVLAVGLYFFLIPGQLAAGGAMGIAMLISHYIPFLQVGQLMLAINILLFLIAFVVLGTSFGLKTIYTSLGLSALIWILENAYPLQKPLTDDLLLAAVMGTVISGAGMGIIFNQGASSGGTDIIAKIINKYTHLDIGKALLVTDALITLLATGVFGLEKGMYALLAVIFNGSVIDYTVQGLNVAMQVFIMTSKPDTIARFIIDHLGRGVTFLSGRGGYSGKELKVIYTVLNRREFVSLKNFIREEDPKAFITVSQAHDVLGEGFKAITSE
ncbi:MAG: YitT family protein [Candidatus Fermentithermobacillus carboniphilus]|uniref:YitT family protein n=1 Tax=Candidatus Fermentithermobacillus carboniphilus TaxID=3085328 RepID=A0AAT9LC66_9FIRM|nr:MAG: YitT family protein [Candidatus Fermentithermobacillus carboniphilus]